VVSREGESRSTRGSTAQHTSCSRPPATSNEHTRRRLGCHLWGLSACLQGLQKHGVGNWRDISTELLPQWDDQSLRVRAARLMGSQSLARYIGWKGDK
jgi:hypothetical protein